MNANPLAAKIASPYVRALFDFSVEKNILHQIVSDFKNLNIFLDENTELIEYFNNPVISQEAKRQVLTKTLKSQLNPETFKFLMILVDRDRINLLHSVVKGYLELVFQTARVRKMEVYAASQLTESQQERLVQKLKDLTGARAVQLDILVDSRLIGGFLIKTESKVIDFTVKNQLQKLAKHLDTVLEI